MKKPVQVAKKQQAIAPQINKQKSPAKGKKQPIRQATAGKNKAPRGAKPFQKMLAPKIENNKNSEDDDENEDSESDSEHSEQFQNDDKKIEDSDSNSDDAEEEEDDNNDGNMDSDENEGPEEFGIKKGIKEEAKEDEESDEESEEAPEDDDNKSDEKKPNAGNNEKKENFTHNKFKSQNSQPQNQPDNRDRKVYVKRLAPSTTEDQIRKHFEGCGEIELLKISPKQNRLEAIVVFKDEDGSKRAADLHNSILNDVNIHVYEASKERRFISDPHRCIILMNPNGLQNLEASKLEKIFSKCGEIVSLSIVCDKRVLAFVDFKDVESIEKALALDGTTENGIELQITRNFGDHKTRIFVKNIAKGVTEDELRKFFESCGAIQEVKLKSNGNLPSTAIIKFEQDEGYCQSFLLHEENLRGKPLLLEPFTEKRLLKANTHFKGKRPQPGMWKKGFPPHKKMRNFNN